MNIKLLPSQIAAIWPSIKFAVVKADGIPEERRDRCLNALLNDLLSDRSQCFVRLSNEKHLQALAITNFIHDEITGNKSLVIRCLYSFQSAQQDEWKAGVDILKQFAKIKGCNRLVAYSRSQQVFELIEPLGFQESYRCYIIDLEN